MAPAHHGSIVISPAADAGSSAVASQLVTSRPVDIDWDAVDTLRARDYARLDALDETYLDYTGGGLYAESQLREHMALLSQNVFGNPHSRNPTSMAMTHLAERARAAVLEFFNASPDEYTAIFTPNASGALKLVGEAYPFEPGDQYALTFDNHNSVNGIREFACARGADVSYIPLLAPELRPNERDLLALLDQPRPGRHRLSLSTCRSNASKAGKGYPPAGEARRLSEQHGAGTRRPGSTRKLSGISR
jgi:selenocysteine lyase/cysteine desulfurase